MHFRRRLPFVISCTKTTGARPLMNREHQHISILWILGIQLTISQSALLVPKSLPYLLGSSSSNNKRPSFSSCLIPNTFPHVGPVRQRGRYLSSSCKYQRFRTILESSNKSLLHPFHDDKDSQDNTPSAASSSLSILTKQILSILATQNPTKTRQRLEPIVEFVTLYSSPINTYNHNTHSVMDLPNACSIVDIGCDHGLLTFTLASILKNKYPIIGIDISQQALQNGAYRVRDMIYDILQYHDPITINTSSIIQNTNTTNFIYSHMIHPQQNNNDKSFQDHSIQTKKNVPFLDNVEFRWGNGLCPLLPGEGQTICIMGMGVETMMDILSQSFYGPDPIQEERSSSLSTTTTIIRKQQHVYNQNILLNFLGTRYLFLQPTPSRPRNLVQLYQTLDHMGWTLFDERIHYISSRWYISCAFEKKCREEEEGMNQRKIEPEDSLSDCILPGHFLKQSMDENIQKEYNKYVQHHLSWILQDREKRKSNTCDNNLEQIWLDAHLHLKE